MFKKGIFLFTVSLLCMLSLMGNLIVLDLHHRDIRIEKEMPKWVFFISDYV